MRILWALRDERVSLLHGPQACPVRRCISGFRPFASRLLPEIRLRVVDGGVPCARSFSSETGPAMSSRGSQSHRSAGGHVCANPACLATSAPMWRKGWVKDGQAVTLCNACGILYKRHWFCTLCTRIYRKETASASDGWLSCDYCEGWAHLRCELSAHGIGVVSGPFYACPTCRTDGGHLHSPSGPFAMARNQTAEPRTVAVTAGIERVVHSRPFLKGPAAEGSKAGGAAKNAPADPTAGVADVPAHLDPSPPPSATPLAPTPSPGPKGRPKRSSLVATTPGAPDASPRTTRHRPPPPASFPAGAALPQPPPDMGVAPSPAPAPSDPDLFRRIMSEFRASTPRDLAIRIPEDGSEEEDGYGTGAGMAGAAAMHAAMGAEADAEVAAKGAARDSDAGSKRWAVHRQPSSSASATTARLDTASGSGQRSLFSGASPAAWLMSTWTDGAMSDAAGDPSAARLSLPGMGDGDGNSNDPGRPRALAHLSLRGIGAPHAALLGATVRPDVVPSRQAGAGTGAGERPVPTSAVRRHMTSRSMAPVGAAGLEGGAPPSAGLLWSTDGGPAATAATAGAGESCGGAWARGPRGVMRAGTQDGGAGGGWGAASAHVGAGVTASAHEAPLGPLTHTAAFPPFPAPWHALGLSPKSPLFTPGIATAPPVAHPRTRCASHGPVPAPQRRSRARSAMAAGTLGRASFDSAMAARRVGRAHVSLDGGNIVDGHLTAPEALGQPGTHPPPAYLSTSFHDGHHDMPGGPHRPGAATLDVCRRPNDAWMGPGSPGAMDLAEWDPGLGAGDGWGEAAVSLGEVMLGDREGGGLSSVLLPPSLAVDEGMREDSAVMVSDSGMVDNAMMVNFATVDDAGPMTVSTP